MIQDIAPKKLNNQYIMDKVCKDEDMVISFCGNKILVREENGTISFPSVGEWCANKVSGREELIYFFSIDEECFFFEYDFDIDKKAFGGYSYVDIHELRNTKLGPKYRMYALYTAKHLMDWYRDMRFCGRCGKRMHHMKAERAMECDCGYGAYPRIMPAVIVGVLNNDRILLTKYREGYKHYALVAGFTEIGETVEETVAREVMEETGLRVKNIRYYKSQPWGSANDLLLGFYCDVDGDNRIKMDQNELKFAEWLTRDEVELQPDDFSLTNEMMMQFKYGKI